MYCPRCGTKNEDDSLFCKKCGNDLNAGTSGPVPGPAPGPAQAPPPPPPYRRKRRDDECEEECSGGDKNMSWFWGAIIIIIGLWIVFEFGVKNVVDDIPDWLEDFEFCWLIWIVVGIAILAAGFRMIVKARSQ